MEGKVCDRGKNERPVFCWLFAQYSVFPASCAHPDSDGKIGRSGHDSLQQAIANGVLTNSHAGFLTALIGLAAKHRILIV